MLKRVAPKDLVFYIGMGFLIIYSFVMTQGVSPDEVVGGHRITEQICSNVNAMVTSRIETQGDVYGIQQLCTNFVCRTQTMTADDANTVFQAVKQDCNLQDSSSAFEKFVEACSPYCARGAIDVRAVANMISTSMGSVFGRPDYCIFLKKGPMSSVLVPRCLDGMTYQGQPVNLCMKGFSCYLAGPGAPLDQCGCDDLYDLKTASVSYTGDSQSMVGASYADEGYFTRFDDGSISDDFGELTCGDLKEGAVVFSTDDPDRLEWWFRHRAFPPETTDTGWNQFISNQFPKPICVVTFGLLPFMVLFFLLKDTIMYFIPLQQELKDFIAVFIALLSLMFGTFDNMVLLIAKLAGWSLSASFLIFMFGAAMFGAIFNQAMGMYLERQAANKRIIDFAGSLGELSR